MAYAFNDDKGKYDLDENVLGGASNTLYDAELAIAENAADIADIQDSLAGWRVYNYYRELGLSSGCSINQLIAAMPRPSMFIGYALNDITGLPSSQVTLEVIKTDSTNGGFVRCTSIWNGSFWIGVFHATDSVHEWRFFEGTASSA